MLGRWIGAPDRLDREGPIHAARDAFERMRAHLPARVGELAERTRLIKDAVLVAVVRVVRAVVHFFRALFFPALNEERVVPRQPLLEQVRRAEELPGVNRAARGPCGRALIRLFQRIEDRERLFAMARQGIDVTEAMEEIFTLTKYDLDIMLAAQVISLEQVEGIAQKQREEFAEAMAIGRYDAAGAAAARERVDAIEAALQMAGRPLGGRGLAPEEQGAIPLDMDARLRAVAAAEAAAARAAAAQQ